VEQEVGGSSPPNCTIFLFQQIAAQRAEPFWQHIPAKQQPPGERAIACNNFMPESPIVL
jgi:hypothetical protein